MMSFSGRLKVEAGAEDRREEEKAREVKVARVQMVRMVGSWGEWFGKVAVADVRGCVRVMCMLEGFVSWNVVLISTTV